MCTYEHVHGTRDHVNANSGIAYTLSGPQAQPTDNWGKSERRKAIFPDLKMANAIFSFRHFTGYSNSDLGNALI